jgi:hypothetical protein
LTRTINYAKRLRTIFYYEEGNFLEPETAEKVKAEWGATYKETSARDPESVEAIFKSLMNHVDEHGVEKPIDDDKPKNCAIL